MSAITDSLNRGSCTPCTWREDRDVYIREKSEELLKVVIEPIPVTIRGEIFNSGTLDDFRGKKIFGVAQRGDHWLLYAPELNRYSLAFGHDPCSLTILGFSSDDALAEWLG